MIFDSLPRWLLAAIGRRDVAAAAPVPQVAKAREPGVELAEPLGPQRVELPRAVRADPDEPVAFRIARWAWPTCRDGRGTRVLRLAQLDAGGDAAQHARDLAGEIVGAKRFLDEPGAGRDQRLGLRVDRVSGGDEDRDLTPLA